MSAPTRPEIQLRSPLPGVDPTPMPAAHTLLQTREDIAAAAGTRDPDRFISTLKVARELRAPPAG